MKQYEILSRNLKSVIVENCENSFDSLCPEQHWKLSPPEYETVSLSQHTDRGSISIKCNFFYHHSALDSASSVGGFLCGEKLTR
jgi:hypothetical protein